MSRPKKADSLTASERQARYVEKKKNLGLCPRCGNERAKGFVCCAKCRAKNSKAVARTKKAEAAFCKAHKAFFDQWRKEHGL